MTKVGPGTSAADKRRAAAITQFTTPMTSVEDRFAEGKALRGRVPHERHAEYQPPRKREDPVAILEQQARTRLPSLVPIRNARMLASPFAFLRGSAAAMAADLAPTPVTGLTVQACGDMHVANFGLFASAERSLVFGINDFDETLPGAWEWDLKRLAASAVVAGRFLGGDKVVCEESARAAVRSYRKRMREYARMGHLDVWYARLGEQDILAALSPEMRTATERMTAKARKQGHLQALDKMAELVDGRQRIVENRPLIVRETHNEDGTPITEGLARTLSYLSQLPR